jgi:DNA-directed RNA polymerase subunit M/transcription elongation factor TFIIS
MSTSESSSESSSSSEEDTITAVSKSSKIHLVNNRVKNYEKDALGRRGGIPTDREGAALYYNRLNDGGADLWENGIKFKDASHKFEKESEVIKNPFPVTESSEPCPKCGSERTLTFFKQTRSADEATTVSIFCGKCGKTTRL